jgi:hypothetical protein
MKWGLERKQWIELEHAATTILETIEKLNWDWTGQHGDLSWFNQPYKGYSQQQWST